MELIERCKIAIKENRCLGCQALENPYFKGNMDCEYGRVPTAKESIQKIKENLGVQENLWKKN